jgi:D-sedoheptulose 7-phosphate isomerase
VKGKGKMKGQVQEYIQSLQETLDNLPLAQIERVIELLLEAQQGRRTVFIFGNGGSASTASHFACDLGKSTALPGMPRLRVISLTDNVELITAWANDTAYEHIFAEQLRGLVEPGDVVIGISGSGRSKNVLNAIALAHRVGATTIGLSGFDGGALASMVDVSVVVPSNCMERIEDVHLILEHTISSIIRETLRQQASLWMELHTDQGQGTHPGFGVPVLSLPKSQDQDSGKNGHSQKRPL